MHGWEISLEPNGKRIYPLPGEDPRWDAIQDFCRKMSAEMLGWQMGEFAEWDKRAAERKAAGNN